MVDEKFDCIVIGGGIAGLSAAMVLAKGNANFLLVERGEFCGSKNVSGGVLWGTDLARLVPNYWDESDGYERFINHRRITFLDEQSAMSVDFKSAHFDQPPYTGVAVLRSRFDEWLAGKVQDAIDASESPDSLLATNVLVEELVIEDGRVTGIRTGEEVFYTDCVIIAEGINNLLTRQCGLQSDYVPADYIATGVKEVIKLDENVLAERFQLNGRSGLSNEFVGFASKGVEGGGFLYTNQSSLSVGLVLGLSDLREKKKKPYELLNDFKGHPVVADMIRGGEVVEYSAHTVSTGDIRGLPREIFSDGVLIAGEAANLLMNSGKAIQGMDYAMRSGMLAAESVLEAAERQDFSAASLKSYRTNLEQCYVLKDMKGFQNAVQLLHNPFMFDRLPNLMCDFGKRFFTIDNQPTPKASKIMKACIKEHSSFWELARLGFKAYRSL